MRRCAHRLYVAASIACSPLLSSLGTAQLVEAVGEYNSTCYQSHCDAGACQYSFMDRASCGYNSSPGSCMQFLCSQEQGGCIALPVTDGMPCNGNLLSVVDQCNEAQCRSGACVVVPLNGTPCSDGNPCTIQPGMPSLSCFVTFFFTSRRHTSTIRHVHVAVCRSVGLCWIRRLLRR